MRFLSTFALLVTAIAVASTATPASAQVIDSTYRVDAKDLYVMMFRADWCPPCKVVEPRLDRALQTLRDPRIEYVEIDISSPGASEIAAHAAFDREVVPQYNRWLGLTGFAAIVDATTKRTLGCVNVLYDAASMTSHIRTLKQQALRDEQTVDFTCPEAHNPG